jgi:hypothetical protein
VKIDYAKDVVKVGLLINPVPNRPEVVAKMKISGGLNP